MSSPVYANLPSAVECPKPTGITAATSTQARLLCEPLAAALAVAPAPQFYGGAKVSDLVASSTSGSATDLTLYRGEVLTTQSTSATGTLSVATSTTITRTTGSFITDGWKPGMLVSAFGADADGVMAANEGFLGLVTTVAALTLTFTVIGSAWAVAALASNCRLVALSQLFVFTVPANAGNAAATANFAVINSTNDSSLLTTEIKLDAMSVLAVRANAAVAASPAVVTFTMTRERY